MQSETSLDMFHSPTGQHDGGASGALILTPESTGQADQFSQSISSSSSWEHRDTPSHISLCSKNALAWLRDRVVPDDEQLLIETLARLSFDVQQKSTLEVSVATVAIPEPDAHTAWEYCEGRYLCRISTLRLTPVKNILVLGLIDFLVAMRTLGISRSWPADSHPRCRRTARLRESPSQTF